MENPYILLYIYIYIYIYRKRALVMYTWNFQNDTKLYKVAAMKMLRNYFYKNSFLPVNFLCDCYHWLWLFLYFTIMRPPPSAKTAREFTIL